MLECVLFSSFFMRGGEWFVIIITFWMRPIYRKVIKTKIGKKIVFLLGNIFSGSIADLTAFYCLVFYEVLCMFVLKIACSIILADNLAFFFLKLYDILAILILYFYVVSILNHMGNHWEALSDDEDFCCSFDNPDDFCKYHDGYFRKEKLAYRIYLEKRVQHI